jgi:hypothetical protein
MVIKKEENVVETDVDIVHMATLTSEGDIEIKPPDFCLPLLLFSSKFKVLTLHELCENQDTISNSQNGRKVRDRGLNFLFL